MKTYLDCIPCFFKQAIEAARPDIIRAMSEKKQYIIDSFPEGQKLRIGDFYAYSKESIIPVRSDKEPKWRTDGAFWKDQ